jgi:ribulose-phosphate 3-epimerase
MIVSASIIAADTSKLLCECRHILSKGVDLLHIDLMDNEFTETNNIAFLKDICHIREELPNALLDIHLMVSNPLLYIIKVACLRPYTCTFHIETIENHNMFSKIVQELRDNNVKIGIAIKMDTSVSILYEYLDRFDVDSILILTVKPGFCGQKMNVSTLQKCFLIKQRYPDIQIQIDGGVDIDTIDTIKKYPVDNVVIGSALFSTSTPEILIKKCKTEN